MSINLPLLIQKHDIYTNRCGNLTFDNTFDAEIYYLNVLDLLELRILLDLLDILDLLDLLYLLDFIDLLG